MRQPSFTRSLPLRLAASLAVLQLLAPAAAQHDCATAVTVPGLPFVESIDTTSAPSSAGAGACNAPAAIAADVLQNALWYRLALPETTAVAISVDGPYDHLCTLWTGSCDALVEIACRDQPQPNLLHVTLTGGVEYWLSVGDFGVIAGGGPTTIQIDVDPSPLLNDDCAGAIEVQLPFLATINTRSANPSPPPGSCNAPAAQDAGVLDNSVWYTLLSPSTTDVQVSLQPEDVWDPLVMVLRGGGCSSLTQVACRDAAEAGHAEMLRWTAQEGIRYWIVIGDRGVLDGGGPAQLTITSPLGACCLPDDACTMLSGTDCLAAGGVFHGDDSACAAPGYDLALGGGADGCGAFEDIAATGTSLPLGEDDGEVIPIGFDFPFFGQTFTQVGISANGYLAFEEALGDFTNDPIPAAASPNGLIAPFWTDLSPQLGGAVQYEVRGVQGADQRLIVQWSDVPRFESQDANTFQAVLFASGDIEFRYGLITRAAFPSACTIGVEDPAGQQGVSIDPAAIGAGQACVTLAATSVGVDCRQVCACEFDGLAGVTIFDLLVYLDAWFIGAPLAEQDGVTGITVLDLLACLQCWFPASGGEPCG